ncbi:class II flagellar assembly regulator [Dongia mobilis]|uniref:Class II flagellar assembly regulator n=1 Tax=Dongia mobilis TaxID=578943 RepID=A0A4R6X1N8_9PROT|nr:flagellar assembly protein FliX [Dongia mobilis]TDQ84378.1 class II flagellar assembly regulator [Dongia mobilis]
MPIKIDPIAPKPVAAGRRVGQATAPGSGTEFARALGDSHAAQGQQVSSSLSVSSLSVVLAVQETPDSTQGRARQRARERGFKMLDYLEEIRLGLLLGMVPRDKLEQLAQMVRARREQVDDPRLTAILDDIELRAAVELAKLSR